MLQRLRHRARGQEGFTLIELLVVILIIGILAAVAIPTFLSQTNKAHDSNAQAYLNSAQTAEATYQTNNGSYTSNVSDLTTIEPTLSSAPSLSISGVSSSGFTISDVSSPDNIKYTLAYDATTGAVTRTCALASGGSAANQGGCNASSQWGN